MFFVRDGIKFPDMVHALKPNPKSHIQEVYIYIIFLKNNFLTYFKDWRILDFFSHHPESLHMVCMYI